MPAFLSDNFLLHSPAAERLYHEFAAAMPIFDYHCHLPVGAIAEDTRFANLTRIWLEGDHYKWRAMRTNGIDEKQITGDASDREKFMAWAQTVPKTLRNPLYHWTHLELKRHFGIQRLLDGDTAEEMYKLYTEELYKFDQLYRHFCHNADVAKAQAWDILKSLRKEVEAAYKNWFLVQLALKWGKFVGSGLLDEWEIMSVTDMTP